MYVNKIENKITFKTKTGYYLELITSETLKLLKSAKSEMNRDKNGKIVSYLKVTEVVLIHCYIVSNYYHQDSKVLFTFVPNKSFAQLLDISPVKPYIFKNI